MYVCIVPVYSCTGTQNELALLEFIHSLVETMDKYFESVCELDVREGDAERGRGIERWLGGNHLHGSEGIHICNLILALFACLCVPVAPFVTIPTMIVYSFIYTLSFVLYHGDMPAYLPVYVWSLFMSGPS